MRGVETKLRLAYRYVRRSRRLRRQLGALSATFPVHDEASLRYYEPQLDDLGADHTVVRDALGRIDETDVLWDVGAEWGAYTGYLGRVCDRTVTLAATGRGPHLRQVLRDNDCDGEVTTGLRRRVAGSLAGLPAATVVRIAGREAFDALGELPAEARLVYVTGLAGETDDLANRLEAVGFAVTRLGRGGHTLRATRPAPPME